jgi:hypothetical protein
MGVARRIEKIVGMFSQSAPFSMKAAARSVESRHEQPFRKEFSMFHISRLTRSLSLAAVVLAGGPWSQPVCAGEPSAAYRASLQRTIELRRQRRQEKLDRQRALVERQMAMIERERALYLAWQAQSRTHDNGRGRGEDK